MNTSPDLTAASHKASARIFERAQKYLGCCEGAVSGARGHDTTFRVTNALVHGFCLEAETTFELLRDVYNPRCSPPWRDHELRHKIASACNTEPIKGRGYLLGRDEFIPPLARVDISPPASKPVFEPAYLAAFTAGLADTVDAEYLAIRSQFTCHNRSPAGFLHKIFRPGESVWVTTNGRSRDGLIWTHEADKGQNLAELNHLIAGHQEGVWYLSNPVDGVEHQADRLVSEFNPSGGSFRCLECITCPGTLTPVRLTRLPNCRRERRLQQLLYLNPDADSTSIAQRPPREDPLDVWLRYYEARKAARSGPSNNP